jgi:hypothetical protein
VAELKTHLRRWGTTKTVCGKLITEWPQEWPDWMAKVPPTRVVGEPTCKNCLKGEALRKVEK